MVLARLAAWLCIAAIGLLSLLPAEDITRSDLGGHGEHVLAYAVTAVMVTLAYRIRPLTGIFAALVAYAACLEYLQRFSPGRSSSIVSAK